MLLCVFFFFKQKTAYELRISDWSSDVCSSDLSVHVDPRDGGRLTVGISSGGVWKSDDAGGSWRQVGRGLRAEYMPPDKAFDLNVQDPHRLAHCPAEPDTDRKSTRLNSSH